MYINQNLLLLNLLPTNSLFVNFRSRSASSLSRASSSACRRSCSVRSIRVVVGGCFTGSGVGTGVYADGWYAGGCGDGKNAAELVGCEDGAGLKRKS